jgi:urate oxidase
MAIRLAAQRYGKSNVRLTKVTRHADRHDLAEYVVDVALEGDFAESYLAGDNRRVVATDTMKNTVYALAADHPLADAESFALALTDHFLLRNAHVAAATVAIVQSQWQRITTPVGPHRHSFVGGGPERRTCRVRRDRAGLEVRSGIAGLPLLKTADSAFRGFPRDEFTTLAETDDRIFATLLNAEWTYRANAEVNWNAAYEGIRSAMIGVFADHQSLAVQQTLYAMGQAALAACDAAASIYLEMPNQHRIPVNLAPLGKPNRNEIFVTTSEPFGLITATLTREGT